MAENGIELYTCRQGVRGDEGDEVKVVLPTTEIHRSGPRSIGTLRRTCSSVFKRDKPFNTVLPQDELYSNIN
jgi:hypothetical protein